MTGRILLGLVAAVSLAAPAAAADFVGTAPLTRFGLGARASGMGGAFAALADDATALYYNPAGLSRLRGRGLTSLYQRRFGVLGVVSVGYAQRGWGLSYTGYTLEGTPYRDEFGGEAGGRFGVGESFVAAAYARQWEALTWASASRLTTRPWRARRAPG